MEPYGTTALMCASLLGCIEKVKSIHVLYRWRRDMDVWDFGFRGFIFTGFSVMGLGLQRFEFQRVQCINGNMSKGFMT